MGPVWISVITYCAVALVVFVVATAFLMQDKSPMYGPQEVEEDFINAIFLGILWLPALVIYVISRLVKLLGKALDWALSKCEQQKQTV